MERIGQQSKLTVNVQCCFALHRFTLDGKQAVRVTAQFAIERKGADGQLGLPNRLRPAPDFLGIKVNIQVGAGESLDRAKVAAQFQVIAGCR